MNRIDIYQEVVKQLEDRKALLQKELDQLNDAASGETKSSAGDKHETARAMMHIEREKLSRQLLEVMQQQAELGSIDLEQSTQKAAKGALIHTDKGLFFLAIPIGKVQVDQQEVVVLSVLSPLGKCFLGKEKGDQVRFRTSTYKLLEIS